MGIVYGGMGGGGFKAQLIAEGTLTATGHIDDILLIWAGRITQYFGQIDLDNLDAGDSVTIRTVIGGVTHGTAIYNGPLSQPLILIDRHPVDMGDSFQITLEQTAGVMRDFDYKVFEGG